LQPFKFNFFEILSVGCLSQEGVSYYTLVFAMTALPIVVIALLMTLGKIVGGEMQQFARTASLATMYLVLPSVSTLVFGLFPCDDLANGEEYLRADYSLSCLSPVRPGIITYGAVMLLVYPLGIPAVFAWLLVRRKSKIKASVAERDEDEAIRGTCFLWEAYKPKYWWYEIFETARRLALTGGLGLIKPGTETQLATGLLLATIGMVVQARFSPYLNKRDNVLSLLSNIQIFLVLMAALMLAKSGNLVDKEDNDDKYDESGMGNVLIAVNVLAGLTFVFWGYFETVMAINEEEEGRREGGDMGAFQVFASFRKKASLRSFMAGGSSKSTSANSSKDLAPVVEESSEDDSKDDSSKGDFEMTEIYGSDGDARIASVNPMRSSKSFVKSANSKDGVADVASEPEAAVKNEVSWADEDVYIAHYDPGADAYYYENRASGLVVWNAPKGANVIHNSV
jgi:hypothetical protein